MHVFMLLDILYFNKGFLERFFIFLDFFNLFICQFAEFCYFAMATILLGILQPKTVLNALSEPISAIHMPRPTQFSTLYGLKVGVYCVVQLRLRSGELGGGNVYPNNGGDNGAVRGRIAVTRITSTKI
jgi:hypothetical protein